MPFHEIREVSFASRFNSVWDRRRQPEPGQNRKRLKRGRGDARRLADPDKEIDIWA